MTKEFEDCLERKRIIRFEEAKNLVSKEMSLAEQDRGSAQKSLEEGNFKWSIIQAYYSMFHSARALIYSQGYRERSHYCLIEAVRTIFVEKRLLSYKLVEAFQLGKTLRENADYYGEFSEEAAQEMLESAKSFIETTKGLVANNE